MDRSASEPLKSSPHRCGTHGAALGVISRQGPQPCATQLATRFSAMTWAMGLLVFVLGTLAAPSSARAAGLMLMDQHLELTPVSLVSMDESRISYFDAQGSLQTRATIDYLQLQRQTPDTPPVPPVPATPATATAPPAPAGEGAASSGVVPPSAGAVGQAGAAATQPEGQAMSAGVVTLIDGQRLVGQLVATDDQGQIMTWQTPSAGQLVFKLDRVQRWQQGDKAEGSSQALSGATPVTQDQLVLTNGDELTGYVAAVTLSNISFQPAGSTQPVALARSSVASMTLANVPVAQKQPTSLVRLIDGCQLRLTRFLIEQGKLSFKAVLSQEDQMVTLDLNQLQRLDMANTRWRLVAWSDLPYQITAGARVFDAPSPPRLDGEGLHLHAPLTMTFTLPKGAIAAGADVALDVAENNPARSWADMLVILQADDASPTQLAINAEHPRGRLTARTPGQRLTLTLDPALNGPIMDRLKLTNAWVVAPNQP